MTKKIVTAIAGAAVLNVASTGVLSWFASPLSGGYLTGTACLAQEHGGHEHSHGPARRPDPAERRTDDVVCPIDGMKMHPSPDTPSAQYQGKTYYFCSGTEMETFLKSPERYVK